MLIVAQSIGEYAGAGGGIVGAIGRLVTSVTEFVTTSLSDHTAIWIVVLCMAAWWLFRRR